MPKINNKLFLFFTSLFLFLGIYFFFPPTASAYWDCIDESCIGGRSHCDINFPAYPECQNLVCEPVPEPNCVGQCCRWEPDPSPSPSPSPAGCQNNADCGVCKQCCVGDPNYCSGYGYYCSGAQIPGCWASPSPSPSGSCPVMGCSYTQNVPVATCASGIQIVTGNNPNGCTGRNVCTPCNYIDGCSDVTCYVPGASPSPSPPPSPSPSSSPPPSPSPSPPPSCSASALTITPNPANVGQQMTFQYNSNQSTYVGNTWFPPNSVVSCNEQLANYRVICTAQNATASPGTWTHSWGWNNWNQCSRTATYTINNPIRPWIQVTGDVHSNVRINAPGGP